MSTVSAMYACLVCLDVYSLLNKSPMSANTPQADARKLQLELSHYHTRIQRLNFSKTYHFLKHVKVLKHTIVQITNEHLLKWCGCCEALNFRGI